jgi:hypothetical protein
MIVNYKVNGWEIVTQRTHALLAMQLALQWKSAVFGSVDLTRRSTRF